MVNTQFKNRRTWQISTSAPWAANPKRGENFRGYEDLRYSVNEMGMRSR